MAFPRKTSRLEQLVQLLLLLAAVFFATDLVEAWNAKACSESLYAGCYPWGDNAALQGISPWYYLSREAYLAHTGLLTGLCFLGALIPWVMPGIRTTIVALAVVAGVFVGWQAMGPEIMGVA